MRHDRGGTVMKTGKVGRVNVIRQQILLPGEIMKPRIRGTVRLTPLRERESIRIHARLDAFMTPVRWLWEDLPLYLANQTGTPTPKTIKTSSSGETSAADYGVGGQGVTKIWKIFKDSVLRIYNEWYKWPEDADITAWPGDGGKAVNLPTAWTRLQQYDLLTSAEATVGTTTKSSKTTFDVRDLAEAQAKFRAAMEEHWLAHERYIPLLKEAWGADGSREVDQVPIRLKGAALGVDPQNLYATDAAGLGSTASLYNFGVDHQFGTVAAPEHCIITYIMLVRFAPVAEDEANPMALLNDTNKPYEDLIGEPGILAAQRPRAVRERDFANSETDTIRGHLPAGWQWRTRWNLIGTRIDIRNSFPIIRTIEGQDRTSLRDATRVGQPFLSQTLGDYIMDLDFMENVDSPIPGARSSLFSGVGSAGRGSAYPYPGPRQVV